jgi:hypothetical protein
MKTWLTLALLCCVPGLAMSQSLRCSNKVISEGSSLLEVASFCGDPAQVQRKSIFNNVSAAVPGQSALVAGSAIEIQVELWTYNFGPNKLMQRIRFEDGVVVRIESLGYGF